ncbi:AAA family ATPase [Vibrio sp. D431a]|uniref:AAA family ATPase n=1 Tax=Vibrio sp. D431a TaxID=2837388 RepID=UPI002555C24A|nr:AAA family ATPase [Vibrio sp. D431a]MDK9790085.1 AAA family ATPase [Vibrio sp. D431a]
MKALTIAVTSQKGGVGKSTLVANLAVLFSEAGKKVLLVDSDPQLTTYYWHQERSENNPDDNLTCIQLTGDVRSSIENLKSNFDIVLIDTIGSAKIKSTISSLMCADVALSPIRPKRRDLATLEDLDDLIHDNVMPINYNLKTYFVISQCPSLPSQYNRILAAKKAVQEFDFESLDSLIFTRNCYDDSEENGQSVVESSDVKARTEMKQLFKELCLKVSIDVDFGDLHE